MVKRLLVLLLLASPLSQAQDVVPDNLFSQAIEKNIKKYQLESDMAYLNQDYDRADFLWDSLIQHVVKGTTLDNFKVRKRSGRIVELNQFEKPVFLMTYASWCTPGVGEVPALNEIAELYNEEIDFVVLYWDRRKDARRNTREYNKYINVVYVDETENKYNHIIEKMKHSVGFPTCFFMDEDKKLIEVRRGVFHPYHETYDVSFNMNYDAFFNGITLLKSGITRTNSGVVSSEEP